MCRPSTPANIATAATARRRNCSASASEAIDGLIHDLATAPVDSKLRPILAFVKKLTLTPARMTQADADAVFAAGWDEAALHSAIAVCCVFNFMNRLVDGHGIEADRASFAERGRKHVEMGYAAQYEAAMAKGTR
jgi:alkylhydroperoxidase family enzyme